ncbi:MAG: PH domain-containing protein [bacterium]|nr:PH domain-containing protein [bacterium]
MSEITIEKYLKKDEKILWRGKAKEGEVLLCAIFNVFPVMLLWLAAEMLILAYAGYNAIFGKFNVYYLILSIAAVLLHFVPIGVWLSGAVKENERIKGDEYYITDKRVIIIHSYAHDSVEFIDRSEIDDAFLKRSFAEVILGSGKIVIETSDEKIVFRSIEDAQNNFKKAYKALFKKQGEASVNDTSVTIENASELDGSDENEKEGYSSTETGNNDEN